MVTMTRDMRPFRANGTAVLEDDVAARLEANGDCKDVRPWPEAAEQSAERQPEPARRFKTKGHS